MKLLEAPGKRKLKGGKRFKAEISPDTLSVRGTAKRRHVRDILPNVRPVKAMESDTTTDLAGELGPDYIASTVGRPRKSKKRR